VLLAPSVPGGGPAGQTCTRCAAGTTSAPSEPPAQLNAIQSWRRLSGTLHVCSSSDKWTELDPECHSWGDVHVPSWKRAATAPPASRCVCQTTTPLARCTAVIPVGCTTFSYKVSHGQWIMSRYKISGTDLANVIATPAAATLSACEFACSASQNCEGVMFTASSRQLSHGRF